MSSESQQDETPHSQAQSTKLHKDVSRVSRRGKKSTRQLHSSMKTTGLPRSEASIAKPSPPSESSLSEVSDSEMSPLRVSKAQLLLSGPTLSGQSPTGSPLSGRLSSELLPHRSSQSEPTALALFTSEGPSSIPSSSERTLEQPSSVVLISETRSVVESWTLIRSKTSLSQTHEERIVPSADGALALGQYAAECQKLGGNVGEIAWHIIDYANRKQIWTYLGVEKQEYLQMLGVGGHLGDLANSYQQTKQRQKRWGGQIAERWGSEWREFMSPLADLVGETILNEWLKLAKTGISKDVAKNMVQEERQKRRESTRRGGKGPEASLTDLQHVLRTVKGLDVSNIPMQIEDLGDLTINMDLDTGVDEVGT